MTIIGTSFKHNSCESADDRSKHWFTEHVMKFMEEFNYQKPIYKLSFYIDCVGKCKYMQTGRHSIH